jgi:hypothetical protein
VPGLPFREVALVDLADRIGGLCTALVEQGLAQAAEKAGAEHLLAQVLAEIRSGDQPPTAIGEHLDELTVALTRVGADDLLSAARRFVPLPGARRAEHGWICPLRHRCGRVATKAQASGEAPECQVAGTAMMVVRIKT